MQSALHLASKEEIENAWAFAVSPGRVRRSLRHTPYAFSKAIITSSSRQAKALGVRAGMRYEEAKLLVPEIKIFVYGN